MDLDHLFQNEEGPFFLPPKSMLMRFAPRTAPVDCTRQVVESMDVFFPLSFALLSLLLRVSAAQLL